MSSPCSGFCRECAGSGDFGADTDPFIAPTGGLHGARLNLGNPELPKRQRLPAMRTKFGTAQEARRSRPSGSALPHSSVEPFFFVPVAD